MHITIWNEYIHEQNNPAVVAVYPRGIHQALAKLLAEPLEKHHGLKAEGLTITTATLEEADHGLTDEVIKKTDVLLWWGHQAHDRVEERIVDRVHRAVMQGMGLIVLHSGHLSKIFTRLMGTTCNLRWREADDRELIWTVHPAHPISRGVPQPLELAAHEMYGEFFDIPVPDELIFVSAFSGGEIFRSGCCFFRGKGRIFYFSPGHETYPVYHQPAIGRILANAACWAYQPERSGIITGHSPNVEKDWWR